MTVRWRLTLVATLVFGIAFVAAAWGLVHVTRTNLVDSIEEAQRSQIDELIKAYKANEQLAPDGPTIIGVAPDGRPY